jgi:uncharacterized membrane protein
MIDKILNFFKADYFVNDTYGWTTNQISHIALSFVLCYLTGWVQTWIMFWLIWELYHLYLSKNIKDFLEDYSFQLLGILIFVYEKPALILAITYLIIVFITKLKKDTNGV